MKKFYILILSIFMLAFSSLPALAAETDEVVVGPTINVSRLENWQESTWALWGFNTAFGPDDTCYYDQMDAYGQLIYEAIDETVSDMIDSALAGTPVTGNDLVVEFTASLPDEDMWAYCYGAVSAYFIDHPRETIFFTGNVGAQCRGDTFYLSLELLDGQVKGRVEKLDAAVETFYQAYTDAGMADAGVLDVERYRYIHDYLCDTCDYNYDALQSNILTPEEKEAAHNAYGALVELAYGSGARRGDVVCEGYADAFLLLCQRVDLPCVFISGESSQSGYFTGYANHAWNAILLDGGWYAVDTTWDDSGFFASLFSPEEFPDFSTDIVIEICDYTYFADNRYFMAGSAVTQDHKAYTQICFQSYYDYGIGSPALEEGRYEGEGMPGAWGLRIYPAQGALMSDVNNIFTYGNSYYNLANAPFVEVYPFETLLVDEPFYVPARPCRVIGDAVLSRSSGYTGSFFTVASGGNLQLLDVELDGSGAASASALISTADSTSRLVLRDVSVGGNAGPAIDAAGPVCLSGDVTVSGSTVDLNLRDGGRAEVRGALSGEILLTAEEDVRCIGPAAGYEWTAADRSVFAPKGDAYRVSYDSSADALYLEADEVYYTADTMPVCVGYQAAESVADLSGSSVSLRNTTVGTEKVRVFVAAYDGAGRMLQLTPVGSGAITLQAGEEVGGLTIPTLHAKTVTCRVFVWGETGCVPLSEAAVWDFS